MPISYECLVYELPEDLDRAKKSGNFEYFQVLLDERQIGRAHV